MYCIKIFERVHLLFSLHSHIRGVVSLCAYTYSIFMLCVYCVNDFDHTRIPSIYRLPYNTYIRSIPLPFFSSSFISLCAWTYHIFFFSVDTNAQHRSSHIHKATITHPTITKPLVFLPCVFWVCVCVSLFSISFSASDRDWVYINWQKVIILSFSMLLFAALSCPLPHSNLDAFATLALMCIYMLFFFPRLALALLFLGRYRYASIVLYVCIRARCLCIAWAQCIST